MRLTGPLCKIALCGPRLLPLESRCLLEAGDGVYAAQLIGVELGGEGGGYCLFSSAWPTSCRQCPCLPWSWRVLGGGYRLSSARVSGRACSKGTLELVKRAHSKFFLEEDEINVPLTLSVVRDKPTDSKQPLFLSLSSFSFLAGFPPIKSTFCCCNMNIRRVSVTVSTTGCIVHWFTPDWLPFLRHVGVLSHCRRLGSAALSQLAFLEEK